MTGLKLLLAAVALILAGLQFGQPVFGYWILVCIYWALNALEGRKKHD